MSDRYPAALISLSVLMSVVVLTATARANPQPLFAADEPLAAVLSVPLTQAYRQKKQKQRAYVAGHWSYTNADGDKVRLPIQIRTRGNFRRINCRQPPLQLNFKKSTLDSTVFSGQDKLKLVNPCTNQGQSEQRILLEELAYRLFQIVAGDYAFATRRIDLAYIDTDKQAMPRQEKTFIIEATENLAERLGGKAFNDSKARHSLLDQEQAALVEVFQYMIGNTDFSLVASPPYDDGCCHNVKLIVFADDARRWMPVPYDFDHAGLIDAPYALPSDKLPIRDVTRRFYMGVCRDAVHIENAVKRHLDKRDAMLAAIDATTGLSERNTKRAHRYLNAFFAIASEPKQVTKKLVKRCRD
ncbi:MAG: hypothetical protein AAGC71_01000 [Pseudomonadota bacterium]